MEAVFYNYNIMAVDQIDVIQVNNIKNREFYRYPGSKFSYIIEYKIY